MQDELDIFSNKAKIAPRLSAPPRPERQLQPPVKKLPQLKKEAPPPPKKVLLEVIRINRAFDSLEEIEAHIVSSPSLAGFKIHKTWKKEHIFCELIGKKK